MKPFFASAVLVLISAAAGARGMDTAAAIAALLSIAVTLYAVICFMDDML